MTTISRRQAIKLNAALVGLALALAACKQVAPTPSQGQANVEAVAAALQNVLNTLKGIPGVAADTLAQIQSWITTINADAANIGTALSPQTSWVTGIADAVAALVPLLTPIFPLAPAIAPVIDAVLSYIPTLLGLFGISTAATSQRAQRAMAAAPTKYPPATALTIIQNAAAAPGGILK